MRKIKNVLLIDDDEPTTFINRKIIEGTGLAEAIHVAHSGEEALALLGVGNRQDLPDLIFLDINMPAMDGWEFIDKYNQLPIAETDKIVIVMLTTSLNPDDEVRANAIREVDAYRSKPLTSQTIKQIADQYFQDGGTRGNA